MMHARAYAKAAIARRAEQRKRRREFLRQLTTQGYGNEGIGSQNPFGIPSNDAESLYAIQLRELAKGWK